MAHHYQKRWVFTWNSDDLGELPNRQNLVDLLNEIAVEGVFQTEAGLKTGRLHYQGRFQLKGSRLGKKRLLEIFEKIFETTNLTLEPETLYDSTKYCKKNETKKAGPFYVGTDSYRQKITPMTIKLRQWQTELLQEIADLDSNLISLEELISEVKSNGYEGDVRQVRRFVELNKNYKLVAMPDSQSKTVKWYVYDTRHASAELLPQTVKHDVSS